MFRLLSYNHPFTYGLLILLAVALRMPSFHPNYVATDEASYIAAAERIVDGGVQYVDTWDNKPPLVIWFYSLFVWVTGSAALTAIRIFTLIYVIIIAFLISYVVNSNKIIQRFSFMPALLFILLSSVPWYSLELNAELLMLLPVCIAFFQLSMLEERSETNNRRLLLAGMMMGISVMIKYQAFFLLVGLVFAYANFQPPRFQELFSLAAGFVMSLFIIIVVLYFNGALGAFWDVGFIYNLDYLFVGKNPGERVQPLLNIFEYLKLWGIFLFVGLIGMAHFRFNYFKNTIRLRKVESILFFWFLSALFTIAIGFGRMYLHYFILLVPPLAVYASKFFDLEIKKFFLYLIFLIGFFFPAFTYTEFLIAAFPKTFNFADAYIDHREVNTDEVLVDPYHESPFGWVETHRFMLNNPDPLEKYIDRSKVKNGILILDFVPEHYYRLGLPCATKYTNFSMAWYKIDFLKHNKDFSLFSARETDLDVYKAFRDDMPEYIVDPNGIFEEMREKIPLLLSDYQQVSVKYFKKGDDKYKIWVLSP